ncbi:MAG: cell division protein FtsZ, partial [bacterium]|nr:cell division protein FtsZ [bacterium]
MKKKSKKPAKRPTKKLVKKLIKKPVRKPVKRFFKKTKKRTIEKAKAKAKAKAKKPSSLKLRRPKKESGVSLDTVHATKIRVVGIGGGGGSIVSEIASRIRKADFVVANTDTKALNSTKKVKKFQFGQSITKGLGTGMNVETGELAAQEDKERIKKLFEGQDICIIVSCLGGGAGSGGTPIFAKISKNSGCLTYGIFTTPFKFEGEKKTEIARDALKKIKSHLNAFSVIPNERIFQIIDKNTPLKDALSAINEKLASNLEGLIEMIYSPGLINIDFADLKTILAGRGKLAYLNTVEIKEPEKEESAKKIVFSSLYPYTIKGAKGILYNILGNKALKLSEVSRLSEIISQSVNKNAKIIFGIGQSREKQEGIKITLLATGCAIKGFLAKPDSEKPKIKKKRRPALKIKPQPQPQPQPVIEQPKIVKPKPIIKIKPTRSNDRAPGRRVIQPGLMTGQANEPK